MKKVKSYRDLPYTACSACMACIDVCHHNALSPIIDEDGYYQISGDADKCIECGLCVKTCPVLKNEAEVNSLRNAFAVWNSNEELRSKSASGGAFSALAEEVLRQGGIIYGAKIDGFRIKHARVDSIKNLPPLLGSKYQHSEKQGIYKQVRKDLKEGKLVLFSGMSCEIAGLKSFLSNTPQDNLYTVDTICGGHSTLLPMLSLENSGKYLGIHSFRNKDNGWRPRGYRYDLKMLEKNGLIADLALDNIVLNTFSSKLLKRSSCLECKFNGLDRISDCTIGDFWGLDDYKDQHPKGVSVLVVNNERIMPLISASTLHLESVTIEDVERENPCYIGTSHRLIRHFYSRRLALQYFRDNKISKAMHLMKPRSWAGIAMSIYLKLTK